MNQCTALMNKKRGQLLLASPQSTKGARLDSHCQCVRKLELAPFFRAAMAAQPHLEHLIFGNFKSLVMQKVLSCF